MHLVWHVQKLPGQNQFVPEHISILSGICIFVMTEFKVSLNLEIIGRCISYHFLIENQPCPLHVLWLRPKIDTRDRIDIVHLPNVNHGVYKQVLVVIGQIWEDIESTLKECTHCRISNSLQPSTRTRGVLHIVEQNQKLSY